MKKQNIEIPYEVFSIDELNAEDQQLLQAAREATGRSYAPYSHFHVGAAVLLDNGVIVTGTNQWHHPQGFALSGLRYFMPIRNILTKK